MLKSTVCLLALLGLVSTAEAEVRTWTNVSGGKVKAEYVRVEGSRVVLRLANGREQGISLSRLSAGDRAYVKQVSAPKPAPAKPAAVPVAKPKAAKAAPAKKAPAKKEGLFSFSAVPKVMPADCPGFEFRNPNDAQCLGIQFGPGSEDVVYLGFDFPGNSEPADVLHLYSPSMPQFRQGQALQGKKGKKGEQVFGPITMTGTFGEFNADYSLELVCGVNEKWWLVRSATQVTLRKPGSSCSFTVGEVVNTHLSPETGPIKTIPFLGEPKLNAGANLAHGSGQVAVALNMGKWQLVPGQSMDPTIAVDIQEEDGRSAEKAKFKVEEDIIGQHGHGGDFIHNIKKVKDGEKYVLVSTIDLGPIFGTLETRKPFTVPGK